MSTQYHIHFYEKSTSIPLNFKVQPTYKISIEYFNHAEVDKQLVEKYIAYTFSHSVPTQQPVRVKHICKEVS